MGLNSPDLLCHICSRNMWWKTLQPTLDSIVSDYEFINIVRRRLPKTITDKAWIAPKFNASNIRHISRRSFPCSWSSIVYGSKRPITSDSVNNTTPDIVPHLEFWHRWSVPRWLAAVWRRVMCHDSKWLRLMIGYRCNADPMRSWISVEDKAPFKRVIVP